jgi:hypothetical protein
MRAEADRTRRASSESVPREHPEVATRFIQKKIRMASPHVFHHATIAGPYTPTVEK